MINYTTEELRMIGQAGEVWIRILKAREERLIARMHGEFRNGKTEQVAALAELACLRDQINEIDAAMRQNSAQKGKL